MKKFINAPENVVVESMKGFEAAHGDLVKVHYGPDYLIRAEVPAKGKVALVSGGGGKRTRTASFRLYR